MKSGSCSIIWKGARGRLGNDPVFVDPKWTTMHYLIIWTLPASSTYLQVFEFSGHKYKAIDFVFMYFFYFELFVTFLYYLKR